MIFPGSGTTTYAFKWFQVDDKGRLMGSYQSGFRYAKGRWQKGVENPVMCRQGYHVVGFSDLMACVGSGSAAQKRAQLWLVAVRGCGSRHDGKLKSVWANVRPIKMFATYQELAEKFQTTKSQSDVTFMLTFSNEPQGNAYWDHETMKRTCHRAVSEVIASYARSSALLELWDARFPRWGRGSYYDVRRGLRVMRDKV